MLDSGVALSHPRFVFMPTFLLRGGLLTIFVFAPGALLAFLAIDPQPSCPIWFQYQPIDFRLDSDETPVRNIPETMAGGVAVFDYNRDGHPDIFFTNGANINTLKKDSSKYRDRLFRNNGDGTFTDVTEKAGLAGTGFDIGVAVGDYDNDGYPDIFIAGLYRNTLYHNNGDGTFTDVTAKAGLNRTDDPEFGPLWAVAAAWVDVNNDGLLDLFVVNYLQWKRSDKPVCTFQGKADYCHPRYFKPLPNSLYLNNGDGTFTDVSKKWGIRQHLGKGMGVGVADYDNDGRPDLFVTNDSYYNSLFHNLGGKFYEEAMQAGVSLPEDGNFVSGMGLDFRDVNNDGRPDIFFVALNNQTFPLFLNAGKGQFQEVTSPSGLRSETLHMSGFGAGIYDFDNDGWKDIFVTRGHVSALPQPGQAVDQYNTVFRNLGRSGKWEALTKAAGLDATPPARHRGCAFGDFNGDGKIDVVTTAMSAPAEIWINRSPDKSHWLDIALEGTRSNRDGIGARIKVVTKSIGAQYNHMTSSVGYASSSLGPVHFGLGPDKLVDTIEIRWPSGTTQTLHNIKGDRVLNIKEPGSRYSAPKSTGMPARP